MRVFDSIRSMFDSPNPKADALSEIISAMVRGDAALTERLDRQCELHADLIRQYGIQQASSNKQFADLRAIVTQLGEQTKQKPAVARSMAEVRRFAGGSEE